MKDNQDDKMNELGSRLTFEGTVKEGTIIRITGPKTKDFKWTVDCGKFGLISIILPPRGTFEIKAGTIIPGIYVDDVESDIADGDNVIRIEHPDC